MRKYYLLIVFLTACDQWSKWLVRKKMLVGQSTEIVPNLLYFTSHRNSGAAWGVLQGKMALFYVLTAVALLFIWLYLHRYGKRRTLAIILCFLFAGAVGNFIDRLIFKEVTDFIHTTLFDFPIFNLADSFLTCGVVFFLIYMLFDDRKKKRK